MNIVKYCETGVASDMDLIELVDSMKRCFLRPTIILYSLFEVSRLCHWVCNRDNSCIRRPLLQATF